MEQFNSKVLLFGEYAVLHQGMALVIPWDKYHGHFEFIEPTNKTNETALQSNEYLRKFCGFVSSRMDEDFVLEVKKFEQELNQGLFFRSNIPQGYGLGSSGALVAAIVLRYLVKAKHFKDGIKLHTYQKLKELKSNLGGLESFFHGVSSGLDPLSIILNQPILYKDAQDITTAKLPKKNSKKQSNTIFILDTKQPRTTSKMMNIFNSLYQQEEFRREFSTYITENNDKAIQDFLDNDIKGFYNSVEKLSSFQLNYMRDFFPEGLQEEAKKGLDNGDYFLKLCGAGGGGFMLGFTQNWEKTEQTLGSRYQLDQIYCY